MIYHYCIYDCVINGIQCYGGTCKSLDTWNEYLNNPTYPIDFNSYFFRKVNRIDEVPIGAWGNGSKQMQEERERLKGYDTDMKAEYLIYVKDGSFLPTTTRCLNKKETKID